MFYPEYKRNKEFGEYDKVFSLIFGWFSKGENGREDSWQLQPYPKHLQFLHSKFRLQCRSCASKDQLNVWGEIYKLLKNGYFLQKQSSTLFIHGSGWKLRQKHW
jgi:hypothetical protein